MEKEFPLTGVAKVDMQHAGLIKVAGDIEAATEKDHLIRRLLELTQYTSTHFEEEERMLKTLEWDGLPDHMTDHRDFKRKVGSLLSAYSRLGVDEIKNDLGNYLSDWLIRHIGHEDQKWAQFLELRGTMTGNHSP
jgi:hemerythrin